MRGAYTRLGRLALGLVLLAAGGCTPKHTNMLIFGTDTKIALDVSASPTNAVPYITLGYRRDEVALVPLLANAPVNADLTVKGTPSATSCPPNQSPAPPAGGAEAAPPVCAGAGYAFVARDKGPNSIEHTDAYSTIASFGAHLDSKASAAAEVNGSIATFFATGVAAQKLAEQGGAQLVSTKAAPPGAKAGTFSSDQSRVTMTQWLLPRNPKHVACLAAVTDWMKAKSIEAGIAAFATHKEYDEPRKEAVEDPSLKAACD